jgi:protein subunit release factor B
MEFPVGLSPAVLAKAVSLGVRADDIAEYFVRGSGKGGQKINKTSSTVLLRHLPTGIEVRCQKYREQSKNRLAAYKLLILKIEEKVKGEESELAKRVFKLRKQKMRRSRKAKAKMIEIKKRRGEIKESRQVIR